MEPVYSAAGYALAVNRVRSSGSCLDALNQVILDVLYLKIIIANLYPGRGIGK